MNYYLRIKFILIFSSIFLIANNSFSSETKTLADLITLADFDENYSLKLNCECTVDDLWGSLKEEDKKAFDRWSNNEIRWTSTGNSMGQMEAKAEFDSYITENYREASNLLNDEHRLLFEKLRDEHAKELREAKPEFKLEYVKVAGSPDLQMLIKFRKTIPNDRSTDWDYLSKAYLPTLSDSDKCTLYENLNEVDPIIKQTYNTCEKFIECLDGLTPDDNYLSVNELSLGKLMGITDAINNGDIDLVNDALIETCHPNESDMLNWSMFHDEIEYEEIEENQFVDVKDEDWMKEVDWHESVYEDELNQDAVYCPTIDLEEFEKNYSEGYRGNLSFNFKLYLISKLISSSYATGGNRDYEALISKYSANSTDAINSLIGGADSLGDECDGPCLTSLMESKLREARSCIDRKAQEFIRLKKQIENDSSLDDFTRSKLVGDLFNEKSQYDKEYSNVVSLLERTKASGDRTELKELAAQNRVDITLANANQQLEMEDIGEEFNEKAQRLIELEEKAKGRPLTEEEKDKIRNELKVTTQIFDTDTGEVTREETNIRNALGHDRAVSSGESEVSDSVVNYSDIRNRRDREDQIARDIVERSKANGKEISERDARKIARRLATSKSGIVNYENLGLVPKQTRRYNKNENIADNRQAEQVQAQATEVQNEVQSRTRRPAQVRQPNQFNTGFNNQGYSRGSNSSSTSSRAVAAPTKASIDPASSNNRYSARERSRDETVPSSNGSPAGKSGLESVDGSGDVASSDRDIDIENKIDSNFDDGSGVDIGDTPLNDSPVAQGGGEDARERGAGRGSVSKSVKSGRRGASGGGQGGSAGGSSTSSGSAVYSSINSIPTTYGEVVQSVADRGERELGNEIVRDYFSKYYSHSEGEIPVFREEMFIENSSDVVAFILANGLNGENAVKSFYIAERGGGEGKEKYNYINGKFVPESEGNITFRLKYSGGLNALIEFNL